MASQFKFWMPRMQISKDYLYDTYNCLICAMQMYMNGAFRNQSIQSLLFHLMLPSWCSSLSCPVFFLLLVRVALSVCIELYAWICESVNLDFWIAVCGTVALWAFELFDFTSVKQLMSHKAMFRRKFFSAGFTGNLGSRIVCAMHVGGDHWGRLCSEFAVWTGKNFAGWMFTVLMLDQGT